MNGSILILEDDETFGLFLQTILEGQQYEVRWARNGDEARKLLATATFDLVISDLKLPGISGLELFRETRVDPGAPPFIFLTAFGTVDEAVTAMKEGAVDFLTKPLPSPDALLSVVRRALESQERSRVLSALKEAEASGMPPEELVFAGEAMQEVHNLVNEVAKTNAGVIIYGESGTGKELVARTIHLLSARGGGPFVPLNCAAIPENLLESELFGHEKGAFTGAYQARQGKFELARGGTIFLDEIGEMPLMLQAKLLRVLQERVFERVGGNREIKADVRIISATNRNLVDEVAARRFREDLFYRLNIFPLHLPPLRERLEIIPLLVEYFIAKYSRETGKAVKGVDPAALKPLMEYNWPGNIRELQNVMERGVILAQGTVRPENLPAAILLPRPEEARESRDVLKSVERDMIVKALRKNDGNRRLTAEELGMSRRTLQYKLKEHGLLDER